ncbi:hypothetical protein [Francisella philomiragia]|uniref:hypothetical protein n=1 Tax=Francisella philomiragia TaxID=28110 RepID=UPI001B8CCDCE|nr:hypothetical protein [Francisella philomiragia]QUE32407.1 hypothetical protein IMS64_09710 [Francisella philomiragia]
MAKLETKIPKTATNIFNIDISLDNIYKDFKIFTLSRRKGKGYIGYLDADTVFGFENVQSCFKGPKGNLWVLIKGCSEPFLRDVNTDLYVCTEVSKASFDDYPYTKPYLANLLLNSLPKYIEEQEFAMNAAGGLYLTNHYKLKKIGKELPESLQVFHAYFKESSLDGEIIKENKDKRSDFSQMVFELGEKQFNNINLLNKYLSKDKDKFITQPRVVYSTLQKALRIAKPEDTNYYVAYGTKSLKYSKLSRTSFNKISFDKSEYKKTRSAMYGRIYLYIDRYLKDYMTLNQEVKFTYQLDIKPRQSTAKFFENFTSKEAVVYLINKTDENIDDLISYSLPLVRSNEVVKGKPNIIIIYPEEDCTNTESGYKKFNLNSSEARKHIYIENIDNKPAMATTMREALLRYDIWNRKITRFNYLDLGLKDTLTVYAIHGKKDYEDLKVMKIYPDATLEYLDGECDKFELEEVTNLKREGVKYIFEYQDNINLLIDSNVSAINQIDGYSDLVQKHEKNEFAEGYLIDSLIDIILKRSDVTDQFRAVFAFIREFHCLPTSEDGYDLDKYITSEDFYSKLLINLKNVDDLEGIESKKIFYNMVLKGIAKSKGCKDIYDGIVSALEDKFVYFESKTKEKYRELYREGFDIHYFYYQTIERGNSLIYKVGANPSGNKKFELINRANFKQLICYNDSSKLLDFLVKMLDVDIIGSGNAVAYPFVCKYLKEGFSDIEDWA